MNGIVNIHKPKGMTSFDVIAKMRRILAMKKIGHAGTLDPDATGVLPVCLGKATKVIEYLMEKEKSYRAVLRLGIETDTQDASGKILKSQAVKASDEEIIKVLHSFVGPCMQLPPMYSAIQIGGKRLYELARQGIEVEREPRMIQILAIRDVTIIRSDDDSVRVRFEVDCSKGTYIRTLCADIGGRLGCGGHMETLERTKSGPFCIDEAITLEALSAHKEAGTLDQVIMGMDKVLGGLPELKVDDERLNRLRNGLKVEMDQISLETGFIRLYNEAGVFMAIGRVTMEEGQAILKSHKWLEV